MTIVTVACSILWIALCAYVVSLSRAAMHRDIQAGTTLRALMIRAVIARRALRGQAILAATTTRAAEEHPAA